ncbi:alpha/beta fold hydrolase [Fluviicola sp.]|uniref:alpha/beta fold hydrolase n=1 Tax=Fluviicola sp. TaxID=1917219 RepID=UPI003D2C5107
MLYSKKIGDLGQPIVILHGIFGSSDNWVTVAKALSNNFQVYLLDLPNHGQSPKSDDFSYKNMSDAILNFLDENKLAQVNLVGHSMGGKVAMTVAKNNPERLLKLVVVDYTPKFHPVQHRMILQGLNSIDLQNLQSRTQANEILKNFEENESVRQFLLKNLYRNVDLGHFDWRINLPVITKEIENISEEIVLRIPFIKPALFIKGETSPYIQPEDKIGILKMFPNSQFKTILGAGHLVHADKPDDFLKVLIEFVKE